MIRQRTGELETRMETRMEFPTRVYVIRLTANSFRYSKALPCVIPFLELIDV